MLAVILRALKDRRTSILIYCLSVIGLLWMYAAIFPSIAKEAANIEALMKFYPEEMMKAFNIDMKSFVTIEGYLAAEQFSIIWPLMLIFILVGFAGGAIAGEVERGTIEIILAQPISRLKIFFGKYLAGLTILIVFTLVSIYSTLPILSAYNIDYNVKSFNMLALLGFLFGLAIYSIAILLSAIFSDKGKVYFVMGGLLMVMYVLNIIAGLKENLSDLKYFSFFYYFNSNQALIHQTIDNWAYLVFGGTALVCTILAAIWFWRRDTV